MGEEVGSGWGIIRGVLFIVLLGRTWGVAQIYLGFVGFVDVGWYGRRYSLGKRSVSFLNILERVSSAFACRPGWAHV